MAPGRITAIHVFPVKSAHAISVAAALATPSGLAWDRQWMVVDAATGKFLTQRQEPRLATIQPSLPLELLEGAAPAPGAVLALTAPGAAAELRVPLAPAGQQPLRRVTCWEWTGAAADEGDAAAAWLSTVLGRDVRLVRYLGSGGDAAGAAAAAAAAAGADPVARPTDAEFCTGEVAFPDGFPILVASEESLQDLNARLPQPVPMARFRPNLVVAGAGAAFAEDAWGRVRVGPGAAGGGGGGGGGGGVEMEVVRPCDRCGLPAVDQETGVKGELNPLDTLSKFRTGKELGWAASRKRWTHASFFATYCRPAAPGVVRAGDAFDVLAARSWAS
ncbi:MAG: MOSC domain-containing protein [Monoraphidium minutum]|nr:MAG: MOSC domain-containing protein [Monoraphidium minutum]